MPGDADVAPTPRRIVWLARAGVWLVRLLGWTWRVRVSHDDAVRRARDAKRPIVFTLWHGELLPLLYHHRGEGVAVMISEHGDGEIIARIATALGFATVRGSTSRGAARALLAAARVVDEGGELAVTPDGPRGPAKSFAPGPVLIAQRTGAVVIAAAAHASRARRLESWDRFMIPAPFATVRVAYSDALELDATDERGVDAQVERLRGLMAAAEARARG